MCVHALTHTEQDEQMVLWALHAYHYPIPRLNIKGLHRDTCCVHGPALNLMDGPWVGVEPKYVTVFPHAINHGAMFDLDLVARLANATGNEMRAVSQIRCARPRTGIVRCVSSGLSPQPSA